MNDTLQFPMPEPTPEQMRLMKMQVGRQFHDRLRHIAILCQKKLRGMSDEQAAAVVAAADFVVEAMAEEGVEVVSDKGAPRSVKGALDDGIDILDLVPMVAAVVGSSDLLAMSEGGRIVTVAAPGPSRVCAVVALSLVAAALRSQEDSWLASEGGYFAIMAGHVFGLSQAIDIQGEPLRQVEAQSRMQRLAAQRWRQDPTRAAWQDVHAEWERWQQDRSLYRYPKDFRLAMQRKYPQLVDGTLKNRMSEWGRAVRNS